jgi:tRNA threonylcarbamoyladenosine biosynthesis protein TsaE
VTKLQYLSKSEEDTIAFAKKFSQQIPPNSILCFFGDLGAGKTTFIKGLVVAMTQCEQDLVNSPTFVYLNIYPADKAGNKAVYHFDLYRLRDLDEFLSMGFDEMFYAGGVCCIEWSERIASLLPPEAIYVTISHIKENERLIVIESDEIQF